MASGSVGGRGSDYLAPETAEERAALEAQLDRVAEEKRRARAEPGPTWRQWWFQSGAKWYLGLALLIVDLWVVTFWLEAGSLLLGLLSLVALAYVEFILWGFLWFRPTADELRRRRGFRPTVLRPFRYGRWTPEAELARDQGRLANREGEPDLREFV